MIGLSGWGTSPRRQPNFWRRGRRLARGIAWLSDPVSSRGRGRAYGDAAIGPQLTVSSLGLNRMRRFDLAACGLTVEAGVTVADILATFVPQGFFLKVVPGTKFVTVGGAFAADVHGKNHHRDGGFGKLTESFRLALPGGEIVNCSRSKNSELFAATLAAWA